MRGAVLVGILWGCVLGLQRPAPRYSQQLMPDTSFTCQHKIVGSYYADPETDCQLFHVCVSVAGSIQDYRFLCPNDTAFDQESQTCADWYDVDCEAATLYYASDNFDLYRLGSGLESLHYDSVRNDVEPLDHLQRSESSDPVRSSINNLNRAAAANPNDNNNNRDILRGSSSSNFYNNRNNGKEDDYDNDKVYREGSAVESKRKQGVRKVARKQQYNNNNNNLVPTTVSPAPTYDNQNRNNYQNNAGNYQNGNNFNQRQRTSTLVPSSSARPYEEPQENNFGRINNNNQNNNHQRNSNNNAPSTFRPTTTNSYQENTYTNQQKNYNNFNSNKFTTNQQQNYGSTNFDQTPAIGTTLRPSEYNTNVNNKKKITEQQPFTKQYNNNQYNQYTAQSTTPRATTSFQSTDFTAYQQKNYNNIQRTTNAGSTYQTTTSASTFYDDYATAGRTSDTQTTNKAYTTRQQEFTQTTPRFTNNYAGSSYIPTTYSPVTKKPISANNNNNRDNDQYTGQYDTARTTNGGQYRAEKSATAEIYRNTQVYDTARTNANNNNNNGQYPKKATQYNNYNTESNFDGTTKSFDNFDLTRAASVAGFSPASVNKLAESPVTLRSTTPFARRTVYSSPNTQRPNSAATDFESQTTPNSRTGSYVSATPRPFTSTPRSVQNSVPTTTVTPKTGKKNDYDYAYYDNAGTLEYDGLDLEQVTGSRDSAKLSRN
ncbi:GATA zinc finger domain-containing protein 14 isoform X2 [Athalia rosae]|uniref:GATA zinc finger domain-containing protein 14 isoform X2 n=1 Tax=Athalia rosae TaxID=37344 RepID=UPI0020347953|nr:GATA zinc finger domain-containing protein 14 isoform X2 [Athalia rosae]